MTNEVAPICLSACRAVLSGAEMQRASGRRCQRRWATDRLREERAGAVRDGSEASHCSEQKFVCQHQPTGSIPIQFTLKVVLVLQ